MCIANGIPAGESRERQTLRESCQCVKQSAYCAFVSTLLKPGQKELWLLN